MAEGFIVVGLDGEGGVVGGSVEKGGFCEIKEDWLLFRKSVSQSGAMLF